MNDVSVICACMNRLDPLLVSISSWLKFNEIKEIIICDWSSDNDLFWLKNKDERIKIVRVEGERYFHIGASFNLAADLATGKEILKLDVDYILNPYYNFFYEYAINQNCFLTGTWTYNHPTLTYLNGMLYIYREHFLKLNGYREDLDSYGYEDSDLYKRLKKQLDLKHLLMENNYTVMHIPHEDSQRSSNYEKKCILTTARQNTMKCNEDYINKRIFEWNVRKTDDRSYIACRI
jgi:hypothetical protein